MTYLNQIKIDSFDANLIDEPDANTTYVGKISRGSAASGWIISKIIVSGITTTITYATITNNPAKATLNAAWADRATTLTYSQLNGI